MKRIQIRDALTKDTAPELLTSLVAQFEAPETVLDLAEVSAIDSSAVSLLLACQRRARQQGIALSCCNLPQGLRSLTHLYAVGELIPTETGV